MSLLELQRRMAEDVRRPLTPEYGMQRVTEDGSSTEDLAASYITPNAQLRSFERLEIYNRQYWFRVIGAVSEDFPALNAVLGAKRFDALILSYLKENPSTSWTLRDLGAKLPAFLEGHPEFGGRRHRLAVDVAHLEWAYVEAFDNGEFPALSPADLAACGADSHLTLQPHVRLLELRYPVDDFIIAVHRAKPASSVASNAVNEGRKSPTRRMAKIKPHTTYLAVHRFDYSVYYKRLDREAYETLRALESGNPLGDALSRGFADSSMPEQEQPEKVREWFATWAELGWFCRDWPSRRLQ